MFGFERHITLVLSALLASIVALFGVDQMQFVHGLAIEMATTRQPIETSFLNLYVNVPLIALAGSFVYLAPGLVGAAALGRSGLSFGRWLFTAFVITMLVQTGALVAIDLVLPGSLRGAALIVVMFGATVAIWLGFNQRIRNTLGGMDIDAKLVVAMMALPVGVLLLMSQRFYFEGLNGDGAHALLSARNFVLTGIPFWPDSAGLISSYPNTTTLAEIFPNAFFVRLFGENPVAAKLAVMPGLAVLMGVVAHTIKAGTGRNLHSGAIVCVALSIGLYAFVLGASASYNPKFADLILPMGREPIIMISFLGFIAYFYRKEWLWVGIFAFMVFIAVPSAPVLIGFFLAATLLFERPFALRQVLIAGCLFLLAAAIAGILTQLWASLGGGGSKNEFSAGALLARLRFVTIFEIERLAFWAVPAGLLPALGLFFWGWQDARTRALSVMALAFIGFFYLQAFRILPHHFSPVMILPVIVFWRLAWVRENARPATIAALCALGLSYVISWPPTMAPNQRTIDIGARMAFEIPNHSRDDVRDNVIQHDLVRAAFPMVYSEEVAKDRHVLAPIALYAHAVEQKRDGQVIDYMIRPTGAPLKDNEIVVSQIEGFDLVVADQAQFAKDSANDGLPRSIATPYYTRREVIFGRNVREGPRPVWDVAKILGLK